jgi:hypothetical protein
LLPEQASAEIAKFCPDSRTEVAELLLHQCGNNLPLLEKLNEIELERFRFAALKLSGGNIDKLREAIELAKKDWRDLLMASEFATDLTAHTRWMPGEHF